MKKITRRQFLTSAGATSAALLLSSLPHAAAADENCLRKVTPAATNSNDLSWDMAEESLTHISDPVFPSSERCFSACCDDMSSGGSVLTDMVLPSVRPACPCGCAGCFRTACVEFAAYSRMGKIASPTAFLRRAYQLRH